MSGKRLGIFGMGRIGQAVARRAQGFDMQVHYHNRLAGSLPKMNLVPPTMPRSKICSV